MCRKCSTFKHQHQAYFSFYFSGLIAANVWAEVWPAMRPNLLVTCSVYQASLKVDYMQTTPHEHLNSAPVGKYVNGQSTHQLKN